MTGTVMDLLGILCTIFDIVAIILLIILLIGWIIIKKEEK